MMFTTKLLAFYVFGFAATATGGANYMLAELAGVEMPWPVQFGVCGMFGSLLWWAMAKTIPKLSDDNRAAISELGEKIDGVRAEIRAGNDSTIAILRDRLSSHSEK